MLKERGGGVCKWRGVTISEGEDEQFDTPTLREAQGLVGELLWLSGRTRPDITHAMGAQPSDASQASGGGTSSKSTSWLPEGDS